MPRISRALGVVVAALVIAGCGSSATSTARIVTSDAAVDSMPLATGGPTTISIEPPPALRGERLAEFKIGRMVAAQSGCLACHRIGDAGTSGPGPNLTHVGSMLSSERIRQAILKPTEPMPSFAHLPRAYLHALVVFLSQLRR